MNQQIEPTTAELVERARDPAAPLQDRHAAFSRLIERSQHLAFGLALTSLRDIEDAREAAQDAFTTVWRRLRQLREASAFAGWLKTIVATECSRRLRRRSRGPEAVELSESVETAAPPDDYRSLVASTLAALPEGERNVTVLFYFLGYTQPEISRLLRLKPGTVGKRLHSARLRIRRGLPASVRADFVRLAPSRSFVERVQLGLFDDYVGEYRFERRPDLIVSIAREGDTLVGEANGQRNVLVSLREGSLLTSHYDGEGRFRRNRRGAVTHFVYYEFGKRLGIARRIDTPR